MKVYIGQTRSRKLIARLNSWGFGEMTVREEFPPKRTPFAFDNGAYKDWTAGRAFAGGVFGEKVEQIRDSGIRPDFLVVPDIVAGGSSSLAFSEKWVPSLIGVAPLYLAVQDGMVEGEAAKACELPYAGIFVGGTLRWKIHTGARWVRFAHERQMPCHIGRVGTYNRTRWARRIGADSIDSALPLWSEENLQRFLAGLRDGKQTEMFA